jgi:hypothetical protein
MQEERAVANGTSERSRLFGLAAGANKIIRRLVENYGVAADFAVHVGISTSVVAKNATENFGH